MVRPTRPGPAVHTNGDRLAEARERFLTTEAVDPNQVRDTIMASWRRSRHWNVAADRIQLRYVRDPDLDSPLIRSALPVLRVLRDHLDGQPISLILTDPAGSMATLERLHALGVKLSIDDFGTGYSSLGRLRELPIHEVKIDKSFVQRSGEDHRDRAVVRSAVQLGHALDLEVVAEGVEDATTYAYLAREGCDSVQGYYLSRPLPPDEFLDWLIGHSASLILSASQESSERLA